MVKSFEGRTIMDIKAILQRLSPVRAAFVADRRANIAITFALATMPVMGLVGAAVDYSHAAAVRTSMQSALDATALAMSKLTPPPPDPNLAATNYFLGLFTLPEKSTIKVTAVYNTNPTSITVGSTASVKSDFMAIMGMPQLPISASSTVAWGITKLQVALALDNTGSMADNGKMTALKTATHQLLTQLQGAATNPGDVQVAIVPFAREVNVGASPTNQAAPWIDWTDWDANNGSDQTVSTCVPHVGRSGKVTQRCSNSTAWVPNAHSTWNGCIADRDQPYDVSNATPDPKNEPTWFPAEQSPWCPAQMMPLSNSWTALNNLVDQMQPNGNTNQTIGLAWAWQALTQGAPLLAPAPTQDTQQVIILLTDGLNTENRFTQNVPDIDARTQAVCTNIKAANNGTSKKILIYTVLVMAGNSGILQNCATDSTKYFALTTSGQIVTAFNTIGTSLTKLRISK
jgi:Flp pilus assembly protein TadG